MTPSDFVVIGSGGGGLVAAVTAADCGLNPIVLEKQSRLGGSTAMSGGVLWLPNNPLMEEEGITDSHSDGLAYFESVVGDIGPASSATRREVFLTAGRDMVNYLREIGVQFVRCGGYSDYYDTRKGGNAEGRSIEPAPFDERRLGGWHDGIVPGQAKGLGLHVKTNEIRSLVHYNRSIKALSIAARVWLRTYASRLRRQELTVSGESLIAQLVKIALEREVPLWTESTGQALIVEHGRVTGIRVQQGPRSVEISAPKGVLLAAGGFAHNAEMRRRYSGAQPNEAQWTGANPGDTGEILAAAIDLGAKTDLLDEAWWYPTTVPAIRHSTLSMARQRPGAILVDPTGKRFCNEANAYVEVGKAMYAHGAVPCWLIFDDRYRRSYALAKSLPGRLPRKWVDDGLVKRSPTVEMLARQMNVNPSALMSTVQRFNEYAEKGRDPDFGRGESAYNKTMGDPGHRPNPSLGPIEESPFYAAEICPSDVGTCGGVVTNEHAQVLDQQGSPIAGLYATGNITATVLGRTYPGAGASIANSMIFGFVAARHASGSSD